jgi:two-component system, NarL family, nitrate/nitrite response regulator NarL
MQRRYDTVIVERNALLREGLTRLLDSSQFHAVTSVSHLDDVALGSLAKEAPVLLLLGIGEDVKPGVRLIEDFKERQPMGRVVVLAERCDVDDAISALRAGANAYLAEVASCDALVKCLELVMLGETIVPFSMLSTLLGHSRLSRESDAGRAIEFDFADAPTLSAREKCILSCLANGSPNKLIARQINVAEATVKVHVKAILRKIRVQNRTQAALWAMTHRGITSGQEDGSSAPAKLVHGVAQSFPRLASVT